MEMKFTLLWKYEIYDEPFIGNIKSISITPDGKYVVVGDGLLLFSENNKKGNIYLLNREGELLWKYKIDGTVESMSITPDGEYIVAGSDNIYFFSREKGLLWKYWTEYSIHSVFITPDGEYIVAGIDNTYLFDRRGKLLKKCKISDKGLKSVESVAITPDGEYIVAGTRDGINSHIYFFSKKGKLLWKYWTENDIYSVFITSDGEYIVAREVGSSSGNIYLLNREGELLWKYETDVGCLFCHPMSITPDGEYIAVGGMRCIYLFTSLQIIEDAKATISQMKSKYNIEEAESVLLQVESALNSGDYLKAKELALKAKQMATIRGEIEDLESKSKMVDVELGEFLEPAKKEFKEGNYEKTLSYINRCKELLEKAKPKLKVELLNTSFVLNRWEKVGMDIINEGDAIAKSIEVIFSDDITIRDLSKIKVEPKNRKKVEFYLKPNVFGEVPLEIEIKCRDHLDRDNKFKQLVILEVKKS